MLDKVKSLKDSRADARTRILTVVAQDEYREWLEKRATARQTQYCASPGFNGTAGQVQPVYMNDKMVEYVAVVGDTRSPHGYSGLPKKLPEGEYHVRLASPSVDAAKLTLGWAMGTYRFDVFTGSNKQPVLLVPPHKDKEETLRMAEAIYRAREIMNLPTNYLGVGALAHRVQALAQKFNAAAVIHDVNDDKNFPLVWHVGKAGQEKPKLVDFTWGNHPDHMNLTVIGKGVVYDTGGLALKPRDSMLTMKKDMGGAAHALALAEMIMGTKLPVNLRVIVPVVENAINERALRNGDIILSRGDKYSIEITNTDAEGRLILADALDLAGAGKVKPDLIIDFATLTAAARTVGEPGTAVIICDDKKIARELEDIGQEIDDRLQSINLDPRNAGRVRAMAADLANSGAALLSHIFAAHFLNVFAPKGVTRIHIDQGCWDADGAKDEGLRTAYEFVKRKALKL